MHRIDHATAAGTPPAPEAPGTPGYFQPGNPVSGTLATVVTADFMNDMQENVVEVIDRAGLAPTKGRKEDLADAIEGMISAALTGAAVGRFEYASASQVRLARGMKGAIFVEIDGKLYTKSDADIVWDLTAHLDAGAEAPGTWYYCYLHESAGVLTPKISATPPVLSAASGKVGYHPAHPGWRFVHSFRNASGGDILEFDCFPDGSTQYRYAQDSVCSKNLGTVVPHVYAAVDLTGYFPATARAFCMEVRMRADTVFPFYGPLSFVGETWWTRPGVHSVGGALPALTFPAVNTFWLPLEPGNHGFAWVGNDTSVGVWDHFPAICGYME